MNLIYHGTSESVACKVMEEGLLPREMTGSKGQWAHTVDSSHRTIHLTMAYAPYFAAVAAGTCDRWAVIAINLDLLDERNLRPDEDFIEQATRGQSALHFRSGQTAEPFPLMSMEERTRVIRDNIDDVAHHWRDSINGLGTVAHIGPISASALHAVSFFSPEKNRTIASLATDPSITLLNHRICESKYHALTRWFFEPTEGTSIEMVPTGLLDSAASDRDALEVVLC